MQSSGTGAISLHPFLFTVQAEHSIEILLLGFCCLYRTSMHITAFDITIKMPSPYMF